MRWGIRAAVRGLVVEGNAAFADHAAEIVMDENRDLLVALA